jgi:hypothetical protein
MALAPMVLALWASIGLRDYVRAYRRLHPTVGDQILPVDRSAEDFWFSPASYVARTPSMLLGTLRIVARRQTDAGLEQARMSYLKRLLLLAVGYLAVFSVLVAALSRA